MDVRVLRNLPIGTVIAAIALVMVGLRYTVGGDVGAAFGAIGAIICVALLPGYFIVNLFVSSDRPPVPECWMLAVGFSLFIVACLCTLALTAHIPIRFVAATLLVAVAAGGALQAIRGRSERKLIDTAPSLLRLAAIAAWLSCIALAYFVGHVDLTAWPIENLQAIAIAEALRTAVSPEQAFYIHGVPPVYPFPAIHYGYALVASIADTSALFVFDKMRWVWTATALSTVFVGVRALSRNEDWAYFALFGASILVLTGPLATVGGFYWGQLATTSHWADVSMNVIAAIALACLFLWLSPDGRSRLHLLVLFSCMGVVLAEVHPRELVEIIVFLGGAIVVVLFARKWRLAVPLAAAAAPPVPAVWLYLKWAKLHAPGIGALLAGSRQTLLSDFHQLNWTEAFRVYTKQVISYDFSMLYGLNGLMLLIAAIVMFLRRDAIAVRAVALGLGGFLLAASFAVVTIPLLFATYDELLFTPICRVIFPLYCLFWIGMALIVDMIANLGQRLRRPARTVAIIVLGVAASLTMTVAARMLGGHQWLPAEALAVLCAISGLASVVWPWRPERSAVPRCTFAFTAGLAVVLPLALINYRSSTSFVGVLEHGGASATPAGAMAAVYRQYGSILPPPPQCTERAVDVLGHKVSDRTCMPPLSVIQSVSRAQLPLYSVLLVDPLGAFTPIGFLPVRVPGPPLGTELCCYRNWSESFSNFREVVVRALEAHGGMPFFAPYENADERYSDARALGVTHVLASPPERERVMAAARARPDLFKLLLDESGWVLVEIVKPTVPEAAGW